MVDKRTSALTAIAGIASDDVIPVDDITDTTETRKVTVDDLHAFNDSRVKELTNTTINADGAGNSITNIENADIKAAAAIDQSKLSLDITNSEINAGAGIDYSKLASLADGNILVGNASNVATSVNPTGDIDIDNAGLTQINSGVIVDADINGSAAVAVSKLNITGTPDGTKFLRDDATWQTVAGGGGGAWAKLAEQDYVAQTTCAISVTPSASALKLRVDISIANGSGAYHPMITVNANAVGNVRTATERMDDGARTPYVAEVGFMCTRDAIAGGDMDGSITAEFDNQQMVFQGRKTCRGTTILNDEEHTFMGSEPRTAAITSFELEDQDAGANTVDAHITVWELVE